MQSNAGLAPEQTATATASRSRRGWRFVRHYLEMTVAMLAGMLLFGGALRLGLSIADVPYSMELYPKLTTLEMALTMAAGMTIWMRVRRHDWPSTLEMSLAMLVPALAVIPLLWLRILDPMTGMTIEHVAMFALMFVIMWRRREEYMSHH